MNAAGAAAAVLLCRCSGPQSALSPAGREAEDLAALFWWMAAGAVVIWAAVAALAIYAVRAEPERASRRVRAMIIGGGAVFPTVVLTFLLIDGFRRMPRLLRSLPEGSLRIAVTGEQWWWRVRYELPDGGMIALANEIRLPVGEPVEFELDSPDVIHSFWIPSLGGKMDMIPGRRNRLVLQPTRTGVFRGVCAEYCGTSHALMGFAAVVMEKDDFARWLAEQRQPAAEPRTPLEKRGREAFFANGCPACHAIAGTPARGTVGPDLTHVGSRITLGAAFIPNEPDAYVRWIERTGEVKPGVHMPAFNMLPSTELRALAAYLESLQ